MKPLPALTHAESLSLDSLWDALMVLNREDVFAQASDGSPWELLTQALTEALRELVGFLATAEYIVQQCHAAGEPPSYIWAHMHEDPPQYDH